MRYLQSEAAECGLVCLAFASAKLGAELDVPELRRKFPVSNRGLTLRQLSEIASALQLLARAVRCEITELKDLKAPAILHWGFNHFVVLEGISREHVTLHDPANGKVRVSLAEASRHFTGVALELSQAPGFQRRREKSPLNMMSWIRLTPALYSGLFQVLLLSLILQIYLVASPFYMQLAIDQAALKGDSALLLTLAFGFGLFGIFNVGAALLRNLAMQQISAHLSWDMGLRLFRHLVRLPLGWFQRRLLADTISRFDAINPIRDLVSGALISSLIDGVFAVTTLIMMFLFSWPLAICACCGVILFIAVRLISLPISLRMSGELLGAHIRENGKRIETIKAIQTIKVMSAETAQETQWSSKYADYIRRTLKVSRFDMSVASLHQIFDVAVSTLLVYLGARAIIANEMTVGILYAFMAYKAQFGGAVGKIVEQLIQWKLSDIYSYRLADIVLSPKEDGIDRLENQVAQINGTIEVDNLSFRYAPHEPFVFKNLSFRIEAGEFIAIAGPSGIGKSSLLKVLCGLYPAQSGEVRLDGRPLSTWGPRTIRSKFGLVMQDDELLSGSIAENVAFFDEHINMERVWSSLAAASLEREVSAMPMKAETLVGDMGGALSGGQKQRLLIARALYKQPRVILMDEATSHLDTDNEHQINIELKKLNITRIVIAHRQETLNSADKIYDMAKENWVVRKQFSTQII
ncbi:peptidase domain-containing ABC transporter [Asticcacaulis taihuensis]|uniref:peptidase domain-containing ABC transporter n=1 Tax=Asticcacaulis taihuensis TaxID=260084 RepID=UPI003F7B66C4